MGFSTPPPMNTYLLAFHKGPSPETRAELYIPWPRSAVYCEMKTSTASVDGQGLTTNPN